MYMNTPEEERALMRATALIEGKVQKAVDQAVQELWDKHGLDVDCEADIQITLPVNQIESAKKD
jgi:hypothetical protein